MNCKPAIEIQETVVAIAESECDRPIEIIVEGVRVIERLGGGEGGSSISTQDYPAAIALSALRVVRANSSGQLIYADSSLSPSVLGVTFSSAIAGSAPITLLSGLLPDSSFNWLPDIPVFLGLDGLLTQNPPVSGWLIPVGMPVGANTLLINIQEAIAL